MAGSIAKAYVQVIPSAEGIKGQLSGVFGKEMPSAGQSAGGIFGGNLISKIKGVIAAAGIGKMFAEAITAGGDLQQSIGGIETLFGAGGKSLEEYAESVGKSVKKASKEYEKLMQAQDEVMENASQAYKNAGMSANEYMETVTGFAASLKQSLGGDTVAAARAADTALRDMADNANKMGTDMESIKNAYQGFAKQNYTMLDNLNKMGASAE